MKAAGMHAAFAAAAEAQVAKRSYAYVAMIMKRESPVRLVL